MPPAARSGSPGLTVAHRAPPCRAGAGHDEGGGVEGRPGDGTINKVDDALARDGPVASAGRHGTVVLDGAHGTASADDLTSAAASLAMVESELGLEPATAHHALDEAFRRI